MQKNTNIMSDIIRKQLILISFFILLISLFFMFDINNKINIGYCSSSTEIVMDVKTNRILHEQDCHKKMYMASTTKILTAIVIIENCDLAELVTVTKKSVGIEGSSIYLEEGEKLTVKHLLYGLMLRSGNDCAETLALHCSGSIEKFTELMNLTAKKIGANNSNFVNPHGLHDDNHYTTAYDLALISAYSMKNKDFKEIVSTQKIKIPFTTKDYDRVLVNKNKMLTEYSGANGIKTGFTKKAGRCLVSSCERNGIELICVVLNCPPMFERSKALLDSCFNEYDNYKLLESDHIIDFIKFGTSDDKTYGVYVKNDVVIALTKEERKNVKIEFNYNKNLLKPIKKDTEIGLVEIFIENNLIFQEKIYTIVEIK